MENNLPNSVKGNQNQDELILQQENEIELEIANQSALISSKLPIENLVQEFASASDFLKKAQLVANAFGMIRRTRPDGSCFYRGLAFAILERLLTHHEDCARLRSRCAEMLAASASLGFNQFTVSDFHDNFLEVIGQIEAGSTGSAQLETLFNSEGESNYIVAYMRILTSIYLQQHADDYQPFLEGDYVSVKEFCAAEVEPMRREADNVTIDALTKALQAPCAIVYMNREGEELNIIYSGPEPYPSRSGRDLNVAEDVPCTMLYRINHFDILYLK